MGRKVSGERYDWKITDFSGADHRFEAFPGYFRQNANKRVFLRVLLSESGTLSGYRL